MSVERTEGQWALKAHAATDWLWFVMQVQAIWLLLTLMGGVVLGAAPATVAVMAATRNRLRGDGGPVWGPALFRWRQEFLAANAVLTLPMLVVGMLLLQLVPGLGPTDSVHRAVVMVAAVLGVAVLSALGPLYVQYELPRRRYVTTAVAWVVRNPGPTLLPVLTLALIWGATSAVPGLLPFVSVGAWLVLDTTLYLAFFRWNDERVSERSQATTN